MENSCRVEHLYSRDFIIQLKEVLRDDKTVREAN